MAKNTRWDIKPEGEKTIVTELTKQLSIATPLSNLLVQRGIDTFEKAKEFFRPKLTELHDPFLMKDMDVAIERIERALGDGEKILIYGDYDVDGTTAVSLVYSFFSKQTDNIDYYIPDRYGEGYGISFKGIDYAEENDISLIIALDCGIKANEKVDYANEKNIDFIICDHHRPGEKLPAAVAILDPKRDDCNYPYDELCGCGIGFKLVQAFSQKNELPFDDLLQYLDLAAISIGCDIVPITGENRILAYHGLHQVNNNPRTGIRCMLALVKLKKALTITDLVFVIGPRINAAGRIDHAKKAVQLLISDKETDALKIGKLINKDNQDRRELDKTITQNALAMVEDVDSLLNAKSCVLHSSEWHKGVIGIVASRVIETYYRPTIILTSDGETASGSARSVKGFDVYNAIEKCSDVITQFGGHMYAAGLTLPKKNINAFRKKFEEVVSSTITEEQLTPVLEIDSELDLIEITPKFFRILSQLAPFGPKNMRPTFITRKVLDSGYSRTIGADNSHLKLSIYQAGNTKLRMDGIGFSMGLRYPKIATGVPFDIVYTIEENKWNGNVTLQLNIKDIRSAHKPREK
ncbi:MAG: single-stranded-DNA-specific exonuclease RecJ [Flavobacteriales bacterium]|nr:single-stranded-DNA-specific exonuclease RecJ [Flavobacteriales bacterium]